MHPRIKYWYDKFISMGMDCEEAELMATLKYEIDKDRSLIGWLQTQGLKGLKGWAQTNCPWLYEICDRAWKWIKSIF